MWLADASTSSGALDAHTSLLLALIGLLSTVLVTALGGVASVLVARANRRNENGEQGPVKGLSFHDYVIGELAVARKRDDDHDEALSMMERRQDQVEKALDIDNINWRPGHD